MKKQLLLFATCVALLSGCKDNDENGRPDSPATQPAITAFVFEAARNPQTLIMDIKCAIDGNEISGLIPYATDLDKLVPSFKGRFAQISVNHTVQQSGVSENDFTKEVVYTVMDSIGQTVDYKVNISCFEGAESDPAITSFVFEAAKNPLYLLSDVECTIDGTSISGLIPYVTDIDKLVPTFLGRFDRISVGKVSQQSGVTANDFTKEVVYTVTDSKGTSAEYKVNLFNFTGLPVVTVETDQRAAITSKENYVNGTLTISKTADFKAGYEGAMRIRGRGNATFGYPKKPYKIKLDEKSEILGMPSDKEWVLLANYCDKSLLRTSIAFKLSELMSMPWTPRTEFVELFLNGRYEGNYLLGEHVKVSKNRLNADDDGYLIERDGYYQQEPLYFMTDRGNPFTFKHPDTDDITQQQVAYIKDYVNKFEYVLYSQNFMDPEEGYRKYIDVDSWVNWYLVQETLCNKDTNYYFFKKNAQPDTKLGMSPVWDFEWSLGIGWNYTEPARHDVLVQRSLYFDRLMQDPYFAGLVKERWKTLKSEYLPQLYAYINETAQKISVSQRANFTKWNILNTPVSVEVITLGTWENEVQYAKDFLTRRVQWLDSAIPTW